jgi:CRP-like cAMP-binding protein
MLDSLTISNRILARLPRKDYQRLLPALEPVSLKFGQVISRPGAAMKYVYFPNDCMVSLITSVGGGQLSESGLIGREGVAGIQVAFGTRKSSFLMVVQGPGTAMRVSAGRLAREIGRGGTLQRELLTFANLLMLQVGQTAGCNRFHSVSQRLARWLLMTRDRMSTNEFELTQNFLAYMLGVRRPGVSHAARALKMKRLIRYSRGRITILDQKGLQGTACTCYEELKSAYRGLSSTGSA